jgi:acetylornithine/N-succinyldiaminopimelate aminotransferase
MSKKQGKFSTDWGSSVQSNYGLPSITLVRGKGSIAIDSDGQKYVDLLSGIATNILGHAHPSIVKAIRKQVGVLGHVSNFYMHPGVIELAQKLQSLVGDESARTFFCNSGAEANEAALKLSRLTGRTGIVATQGAFHGRTMGALAMTGQPSKREPFLPLVPSITHVRYGSLSAMKRAITRKTAMVIVEPILGEAGVVVPPSGYLSGIREMCTHSGALMVVDAVQTGMGRTGQWFGFEHEGIVPDVITLAKGIGGGLPLGAMIALGGASQLFQPGDHGSTFGGNPIACASALAVIKVLEKDEVLLKVQNSLSQILGIKEVRGRGLLLGVVLQSKIAMEIRTELQSAGYLVNAPTGNILRIAPALNIKRAYLEKFVQDFEAIMNRVDHG